MSTSSQAHLLPHPNQSASNSSSYLTLKTGVWAMTSANREVPVTSAEVVDVTMEATSAEVVDVTKDVTPAEVRDVYTAESGAVEIIGAPATLAGSIITIATGTFNNTDAAGVRSTNDTDAGFVPANGTPGVLRVNTSFSGSVSAQGRVGNVDTRRAGKVQIHFEGGRPCSGPPR